MNNFTTRAITGGLFIATLIFFAIWSKYATAILFLFFSIVGTFEYFKIVNGKNGIETNKPLGYLLSISTFALIIASRFNLFSNIAFSMFPNFIFVLLIPIVGLVFLAELFRLKENSFNNILHTILPTLYVASPFALFVISNQFSTTGEYNAHFILCFFYCLWANDTGAYLSGRAFGKTKLFSQISPNKTWEGTIGGAILAITIGYICSIYFKEYSAATWITISILVVIFGSLGDLVESMLKRNFKVKDSGSILPGHGGVLDRFDGLLIAAPVVFFFLAVKDFFSLLQNL